MSFYLGEQQLDVLDVTGTYQPNKTTALKGISIRNNDEITLNFDGLTVPASNQSLSNASEVIVLKIIIDWGDGSQKESIASVFHVEDSSIESKPDSWQQISHTYSMYEERSDVTITISAYNSMHDCATIKIPVKMIYQSFLERGVKWMLVAANITNDNDVSYVFHDYNHRDNVIVKSLKDYSLH